MEKYQWNQRELQNNIKILTEYQQNSNSNTQKQLFQDFITTYQDMIQISSKRKIEDSHHFLDDKLEYSDANHFIQEQINFYANNDLKTLNIILQSFLPLQQVYCPNQELLPIKIAVTNEELIQITTDFIKKMIPISMQKEFLSILNQKNRFQFFYLKDRPDYAGFTFIDPIIFQKYILISRSNQLLDIMYTPHEIFHYLLNDYDLYKSENNNMYYTTEIEGGFANILFATYYYHNAIEYKNYFHLYHLEMYHNLISKLITTNAFLNSLTEKGKFRIHKFNKEISYYELEPFMNIEEIIEYLDDPLDINIKYALGYLVGIDLYNIYQKDPEQAFYLLKKIRLINQEQDIIAMLRRNEITFMDDNYTNLKKYVKEIKKQ